MRFVVVVLSGLALIAAQVAHGGIFVPFLFTPSLLLVGMALCVAVYAQFRSPTLPLPQLISAVCLGGFILWRCAIAEDEQLARIDAGHALLYFGVWLAVVSVLVGRTIPVYVLGIILGSVLMESAFAIRQAAESDGSSIPFWFSESLQKTYFGRFETRVRGLFMNPNQLAWTANVGAMLALGLGIWGRVKLLWRLLLIYFGVVFVGISLLTASRGGILSLIVGATAFLALSLLVVLRCGSTQRKGLVMGIAVSMTTVGAVLAIIYSNLWVAQGRVDSMWDAGIRGKLVENALRLFQEAPLFGAGPGTFVYAAREFRGRFNLGDPFFAHNDWLQFAAEYGYIGLLFWVVLVVVLVSGAVRELLRLSRAAVDLHDRPVSVRGGILIGAISAFACCLAHGITDFNFHIPANGVLAALVMALLVPRRTREQERRVTITRRAVASIVLIATGGLVFLYLGVYARTDYWSLRASNELLRGRAELAVASAERGLAIRPHDATLNQIMGLAQFGYGSSIEMAKFADDGGLVIDEISGEEPAEETLGEAQQVDRNEAALAAFLAAIEAQPRERRHWVEASRVAAEMGEQERALEFARRAIALDPVHGYCWENYAELIENQGDISEAIRIYDIAGSLDGGENSIYEAIFLREEMESEESLEEP